MDETKMFAHTNYYYSSVKATRMSQYSKFTVANFQKINIYSLYKLMGLIMAFSYIHLYITYLDHFHPLTLFYYCPASLLLVTFLFQIAIFLLFHVFLNKKYRFHI
jgi:hypothetical protein